MFRCLSPSRRAFRWWLLFERARRADNRRGHIFTDLLAAPEIAMWDAKVRCPVLQRRITKNMIRHEERKVRRQRMRKQ